MRIKDTRIAILKSDKAGEAFSFDGVVSRRADIYKNEVSLRSACASVLRRASKSDSRQAAYFISREVVLLFPPVAIAKILAQEIWRSIREERHRLKKINIVLYSTKIQKLFNKVITGYLTHLLEVLTQGPFVTVDTIIEVDGGIVLIKRSNPPFGWALPGGFLDYGESLEAAAAREASEETGLRVKNLKQMHVYSQPGRDPRFQTVTTVFVCQAKGKPCAASDAQDAKVFPLKSWERVHMAFDHARVLKDYLTWKK